MMTTRDKSLLALATIQAITLDDCGDVRDLHDHSLRFLIADQRTEGDIEAQLGRIYSVDYTDNLLGHDLWGIWIDRVLVGTAGWTPADSAGRAAHLRDIYVHPMFMRAGLGSALLENAEERAARAGFDTYCVQASARTLGFFDRQGYVIRSHGRRAIGPGITMPVVFMRKQARPFGAPGTRAGTGPVTPAAPENGS